MQRAIKVLMLTWVMIGLLQQTPMHGQLVTPRISYVTSDPSGACGLGPLKYNYTNGNLWGCDNSVWTQISGGTTFTGCPGYTFTGTAGAGCFQGGTTQPGSAGNLIVQSDASGNGQLIENNGSPSRICTAANGQCGGTTIALSSVVVAPLNQIEMFDYNNSSNVTPTARTAYCASTWVQAPTTIRSFGHWAATGAGVGIGVTNWIRNEADGSIALVASMANATGQPQTISSGSSFTLQPNVGYAICYATDTGSTWALRSLLTSTSANTYANAGATRLYTCTTSWTGSGASFAPTGNCTSPSAYNSALIGAVFAYY
jgi:hypothetical protein